jgi:hypothetical protein
MEEYSVLWELVSAVDTARSRAPRGVISFYQFVVLTVQSKERGSGNDLDAERAATVAMPHWPDRSDGHR